MSRVLIAGCGYVGGALGRLLAAQGNDVYGLRRDVAALDEGITPVAADLTRFETIGALPARVDAVVYCVAAKARDEKIYRAAYIDGLGNLLRALREEGQSPRRMIFTSSTSVYGQSRGEWVDESSPTHPEGFAGQIQLAAERLVLAAPWPGIVVRLGGIYGPGRASLLERIGSGRSAAPRKAPHDTPHDTPHYTNRIHRDDAVEVLSHLIRLPDPEPIVLGVDCEPASEHEVHGFIAQELGVSIDPAASTDPESSPQTASSVRRSAGSKRCRNDRLLASGYEFRFPTYREGYRDLIRAADGAALGG